MSQTTRLLHHPMSSGVAVALSTGFYIFSQNPVKATDRIDTEDTLWLWREEADNHCFSELTSWLLMSGFFQ